MKIKITYRLLLMAALLSLSSRVLAQDLPDGVVVSKTVTADATVPFKWNVSTEAYVTGNATEGTQSVVIPTDVVIMFDNGGFNSNNHNTQFGYLKNAAKALIDFIYNNACNNNVTHRVSIIQCNEDHYKPTYKITSANGYKDLTEENYINKGDPTHYLLEWSEYMSFFPAATDDDDNNFITCILKNYTSLNSSSNNTAMLNDIIDKIKDDTDIGGSNCYWHYALPLAQCLFQYGLNNVEENKQSKQDNNKILVFIGGGCERYDEDETTAANLVQQLKNEGVSVYAICAYNDYLSHYYKMVNNSVSTTTNVQLITSNVINTEMFSFEKSINVKADTPDYANWKNSSIAKEQYSDCLTLNNQTLDAIPTSATYDSGTGFFTLTNYDFSSNYWGNHWVNGVQTPSGQKLNLSYPLYFDANNAPEPSDDLKIYTSHNSGVYNGEQLDIRFSDSEITIPTLVVSRSGLNVGESATFNVYKVTDGGETLVGQVSMTCTSKDAAATATLKVPEAGTYRVRETTWGYSSSSGTDYVDKTCNSSSTFTYSFTGTKKANDARHAEAQKTFSFN